MSAPTIPAQRRDVQCLIERLARAGWLVGAWVTEDPFKILLSETGQERMARLREIFARLFPQAFGQKPQPGGLIASAWWRWQFVHLTRELGPPGLSQPEAWLLRTFVTAMRVDERGLPDREQAMCLSPKAQGSPSS